MLISRLLRWSVILMVAIALLAVGALTVLMMSVDPASQAAQLPVRSDISRFSGHQSKYVTVPFNGTSGVSLHYLEAGSNDHGELSFVLLHGFTLNAFSWQAQLESLAQQGRVVAVDQLPYGLSDKLVPGDWAGPNPYARKSAVSLLQALISELDLHNVVLVGNSSGGTLAVELALAEPERVAALVLVAPWVYVTRPVLPRFLAESPPLRRVSLFAARKLGEAMPLLDSSYTDPGRITDERRRLAMIHTQTGNWDLAWAALINRSLSTRIAVADDVNKVQQPVLVLSGDDDRLVPIGDSERVARELPRADFQALAGCGHVAHEECPEAFTLAVSSWLRQLPLSAPTGPR